MKNYIFKLIILLSCASYGYATSEDALIPLTSESVLAGAKHAASLGHYNEALQGLQAWQRQSGQSLHFTQSDRVWYSDLLLFTGNSQFACDEWARFFRVHEGAIDPGCYYAYADALFATNDYANTVKVLDRYLAHESALLRAHSFMGHVCALYSKSSLLSPREADAAYKKALHHCNHFVQEASSCEAGSPKLQSVSVQTWLQVAKAYLELHQSEKAFTLYSSLFVLFDDTDFHPAVFANAAQAALISGHPKAAVKSWQRYFDVAPPLDVSPLDYADMGLALAGAGEYDEAFGCFQKYQALSGQRVCKGYEFPMGAICLAKGDTTGAKTYFDGVFKNFMLDSQLWIYFHSGMFHNAAHLYLSLGDVPMAQNVLGALGQVKPDHKVTLEQFLGLSQGAPEAQKPTESGKRGKRTKGKRASKAACSPLTVGSVRQAVTALNVDICKKRLETLQGLDVSGDEAAHAQCVALIRDLRSVLRLDEVTTSSSSSSSQAPFYDLKKLQTLVFQTEGPVEKLSRLSQKQSDQRRTRIALEMLKARADMPGEVAPLPLEIMPRVRVERLVRPRVDLTVSSSSSSSSTPMVEAPRDTGVPVDFEWLKTSEKDYERLVRIPGMATKFQRFLNEIRINPLEIRSGSGRPERLHADGLFFSRRFDKQNRMVYGVQRQADGSYKVTLLSLLGHYKHLANQLSTSVAASSS